ncbi:MAG: Hsp20/alpha crystallin family protein [Myxococcales bacterium]|nr:Hsp20/alpha crystallin family protein [Myxococcales bacterium]
MSEREPPARRAEFPAGFSTSRAAGPWRPPADVYRTHEGWLVKLELAGVRPDEIEIRVTGPQLRVAGTRRDFVIREAEHAHSMEISYNRFERMIEFPNASTSAQWKRATRTGCCS